MAHQSGILGEGAFYVGESGIGSPQGQSPSLVDMPPIVSSFDELIKSVVKVENMISSIETRLVPISIKRVIPAEPKNEKDTPATSVLRGQILELNRRMINIHAWLSRIENELEI